MDTGTFSLRARRIESPFSRRTVALWSDFFPTHRLRPGQLVQNGFHLFQFGGNFPSNPLSRHQVTLQADTLLLKIHHQFPIFGRERSRVKIPHQEFHRPGQLGHNPLNPFGNRH
jgi:hypothetical protein